jgi:hypothetical protein
MQVRTYSVIVEIWFSKVELVVIARGILRVRGAAQASGPRTDVVRGAIEACRLEALEPTGVRLGGGGGMSREDSH